MVTRRTVHGWLVPFASDGVVASKHVFDGGGVAMARCFVIASETGVIGVVAVAMRPAITATVRLEWED